MEEADFSRALSQIDFGPLSVEVDASSFGKGPDAFVTVRWDERTMQFAAGFNHAQSLRDIRNAIWKAQTWENEGGMKPMVVVPYLNDDALDLLQQEGVCGFDLSGNGFIVISGQLWFLQRGFPNRYPRKRRSRAPYRGKSALVGRTLMVRPRFFSVTNLQTEIEKRGGNLSLGQVSKVLKAMEDDLVVVRKSDEIRLTQPTKLLDALVSGYSRPKPTKTLEAKVILNPDFFANLLNRADELGICVAGFEPQKYAVAPETQERLTIYVEPLAELDLVQAFGLIPVQRFANVVFHVISDPVVYFDLVEADGFRWCSPLQVYLELMQGGKREKDIAFQIQEELLEKAQAG